jgi:hypothetical protein
MIRFANRAAESKDRVMACTIQTLQGIFSRYEGGLTGRLQVDARTP